MRGLLLLGVICVMVGTSATLAACAIQFGVDLPKHEPGMGLLLITVGLLAINEADKKP